MVLWGLTCMLQRRDSPPRRSLRLRWSPAWNVFDPSRVNEEKSPQHALLLISLASHLSSNVNSQTDTTSDQCEEKITPKQIWRFADNHKSYQTFTSNRDLQTNVVHSKFNFLPSLAIDITARYQRTGLKRHLIISSV